MASSATTKIPQDQQEQQQQQQLEREPLLGQQGDVTQEEGGVSVYQNLFSGLFFSLLSWLVSVCIYIHSND